MFFFFFFWETKMMSVKRERIVDPLLLSFSLFICLLTLWLQITFLKKSSCLVFDHLFVRFIFLDHLIIWFRSSKHLIIGLNENLRSVDLENYGNANNNRASKKSSTATAAGSLPFKCDNWLLTSIIVISHLHIEFHH